MKFAKKKSLRKFKTLFVGFLKTINKKECFTAQFNHNIFYYYSKIVETLTMSNIDRTEKLELFLKIYFID